ncbi:unnamed protein product [Rhizophagus irregularis]|nr:unnamed protein product [Rhizophagus irregularis]
MEPEELFEEYFKDELNNQNYIVSNIHIIAISATDAILSDFRELFKRCCCEKLKLPIFKPDKAHPYYNAIRDLQIPSNPKYKQRPLLLMNDLPTINGNDGLTDTTVLEDLSQIKEIMIVMGTSGSGKTRTLIELLCKKYGIYFTGLIKESLPKNDIYATRYSKCLLFARIYTLNYILENYGKINPCNWAILQLCPTVFFDYDIFEEITSEFRKISEQYLDENLRKLIRNISLLVNQKRLPSTSTTDKDKSRPLYSLVIRAFTISGICVIPSGTGLTMKSVLDITGSHTMKGATWNNEDLIVIKNEFGSTKMLRNFLSNLGFHLMITKILCGESALELFEYGVALLHREKDSKLQIIISETPCNRYGDIVGASLFLMQLLSFSKMKVFRDIFKKPLPYNDWKIYEPPNGSLSVLATRKNVAGPDVVTVMCPVNSDKKYIVLIQAKFRLKNKGDVLLTTDPKKFYHTRPEKKGDEAKLLKGKVYEISYDKVTKLIKKNYDGIFRIFISYPAEVTLKEEIEAKEMEVEEEEWVAIIDASNCNRIFEEKHIEMFKELKNPRKRNFDNGQNSSNKKPKALAEVNEAEVNEQHESNLRQTYCIMSSPALRGPSGSMIKK